MLVEIIDPKKLKKIASGNVNIPRVYYDKSRIVRWLYWKRLNKLLMKAKHYAPHASKVLDLGTGSGVFLPSLVKNYDYVAGVDRYTKDAKALTKQLKLNLVDGDINQLPFDPNSFDIVFAASVLEHFQDVEKPIQEIVRVLKPNGLFLSSTPTENALYQVGRKVFGYVKPHDHYQSAKTVRLALMRFLKIENKSHGPFPLGYELSAYELLVSRKNSQKIK
ncbi:MAG: hypothetical protein CR997_13250 [Acidobacteria bacterium]|nr:MAG: hypothetical protein CR997_13250 [Acidobacteriota bacterium]